MTDETAAMADTYVRIPAGGRVESLNAAGGLRPSCLRQQDSAEIKSKGGVVMAAIYWLIAFGGYWWALRIMTTAPDHHLVRGRRGSLPLWQPLFSAPVPGPTSAGICGDFLRYCFLTRQRRSGILTLLRLRRM